MKKTRAQTGSARSSALVDLEERKESLDVVAMSEAGGSLVFDQVGRGIVAPAAFRGETVPDEQIVLGEGAAGLLAPSEDLGIGAAGEHAGAEGRVGDAEVRAATTIKSDTEILLKSRGKIAAGVQADLIDHAGKVDQTADFDVG